MISGSSVLPVMLRDAGRQLTPVLLMVGMPASSHRVSRAI